MKSIKNILNSFLNSVLDFEGDFEMKDVNLTNPYQIEKIKEFKDTISDIKAINKKGDNFIVQMQRKYLGDFSIEILNFNIFKNQNFISRHLIINQETLTQDLDDVEFSFIELPKFNKELKQYKNLEIINDL